MPRVVPCKEKESEKETPGKAAGARLPSMYLLYGMLPGMLPGMHAACAGRPYVHNLRRCASAKRGTRTMRATPTIRPPQVPTVANHIPLLVTTYIPYLSPSARGKTE